jgi:hypothetical protein
MDCPCKRKKINLWKEYCNLTSNPNPWNIVYKIATNKHKRSLSTTTYTSNLNRSVQAMLDHLIATDDQTEDTEYQKSVCIQRKEPNQTSDDREFTPAKVMNVIVYLKDKKAPREGGIIGVIYQRV